MRHIALLLLVMPALAGEIYQYTDANGSKVYTDRPPPGAAKRTDIKQNVIDTSGGNFLVREAMRKHPVVMWATPDCGPLCESGKAFLLKNGIQYAFRNPQASQADQTAFAQVVPDRVVPVLQVGSTVLRGFDPDQWRATLDQAGYPHTVDPTIKAGPAAVAPASGQAKKGQGQ
ncbi:glutaredoxin family protein [Burkholderiaceae bacterium DAT-1]|nr:glutaredoxin family protein [Burkholderiaceae bacterium DAT-1]